MKTRDELAEALLLASVATDPNTRQIGSMSPKAAFDRADEFVAERERRAVHPGDATKDTPFDGSRCGIDQCCANPPTHRDRNDGTGWQSGPCCGSPACCTLGGSEGDGWSRAPLAGAPANERPPSNPPKHYADAAFDGAPHYVAPAETPAPAGLKFTASGALLSTDGHRYAERERDGYSADAAKLGSGFISVVRIAARDRDHAERIVAAMLPVGRGTP